MLVRLIIVTKRYPWAVSTRSPSADDNLTFQNNLNPHHMHLPDGHIRVLTRTNCFALIQMSTKWSLQHLAHVTTAVLSWNAQLLWHFNHIGWSLSKEDSVKFPLGVKITSAMVLWEGLQWHGFILSHSRTHGNWGSVALNKLTAAYSWTFGLLAMDLT